MSWNFKSKWPQDSTVTQNWLAKQALWYDSDLMLAFTIGFAIGIAIGYIL